MAGNLGNWPSKRWPISKIMPSDGSRRDAVLLTAERWYEFTEFGCHLGNIELNVSSDFFCSKGCGMPHPNSTKFLLGGDNHGKLKLEDFSYAAEITDPITDLKLFKPVVWLYQPIKMPSSDPIFQGGYYGHVNLLDSRLIARTLKGNERQGALFRQYEDRVEILRDPSDLIEFDQVIGNDCSMLKDVAASIYDVQISQLTDLQYEPIEPAKPDDFEEAYRKLKLDHTEELAEAYRNAV